MEDLELYIDHKDIILQAVEREFSGSRDESDESADTPDDWIEQWGVLGFSGDLAEMYEDCDKSQLPRPARKLIEIIAWDMLEDMPRALAIPEEQADRFGFDIFLTPKELKEHCGDFAVIDPEKVAEVLYAEGSCLFEEEAILANCIRFWRDAFVEALTKGLTLARRYPG